MKAIEIPFTAWIGNTSKAAKLRQVLGMGGPYHFSLEIQGRFYGWLFTNSAGWCGPDYYLLDDKKVEMTRDDIQALVERIEEAFTLQRLNITIVGVFGDEIRDVSIFEISPGVFEIHMYKGGHYRYMGKITRVNDAEWGGEISRGACDDFTTDDIRIIGDLIDEYRHSWRA